MARGHRKGGGRVVPADDMQISAAHAAAVNRNNDIVGAWRGIFDIFHAHLAGARNNYCPHRRLPSIALTDITAAVRSGRLCPSSMRGTATGLHRPTPRRSVAS